MYVFDAKFLSSAAMSWMWRPKRVLPFLALT